MPDAAALAALGLPHSSHTPHKDLWYLQRRYFAYPHQNYDVWAVQEAGALLAYAITRTITAAETGCVPVVRLVDFIGDDAVLPRIGGALDKLLHDAGAEYLDCYNAGIPAAVWAAAGLTERCEDDGVIIPNYLTPPLRQNTEYYYFTNQPDGFVLFKADGRPGQTQPALRLRITAMKIALVTGASSGLGREFVRQIAEQGKVEEIWAIARRRDRWKRCNPSARCPSGCWRLILTRPGDMEYLRNTLQDELPDIRILVNAAGMGRMGPTVDIPAKDNDAMIDLNCRAAVDVTDAAFPYLHPGSQILEICSTAGVPAHSGAERIRRHQGVPAQLHPDAALRAFPCGHPCYCGMPLLGQGYRVHWHCGKRRAMAPPLSAGQPQPGCCAPRPAGTAR